MTGVSIISSFFVNISKDVSDWIIRLLFFWLIQGPKKYWKKMLGLSATFEDVWATAITFRYLFTPLYQDYSIIGRILGPLFRTGRILAGIAVHLILLAIYLVVFLLLCLLFWGAPLFFVLNLFIWNQ